jgi:superfamily II DNA or RNA helicase
MSGLRPYQVKSIEMIFDALRLNQKAVLCAPTGAGKTRIASEIFAKGHKVGRRMGFCVPFLSLVNQTWRAFVAAGIPEDQIGIIQADHQLTNWSLPIQVMSVETLNRRKKLPEMDLVIFDEVHRQSKLYKRWMDESPQTKFLGCSATPWAKGMTDIWDRLLVPTSMGELISQGYLSPYRFFAPASPDLSGVKVRAGDYAEDQLAEAMNKPKLIADIVTTWLENAGGRRTFVFAVDRAHAKQIQTQFIEAGVKAEYIDAYTDVDERDVMLAKLARHEIDMITSVGCLTTGVDCPNVDCIIIARPTRSEMLYIQMVGRGLRTASGKQDCLSRGTMILTDKGETPIESVTLDHKVWDGVRFVAHGGSICRGVQTVITYDGVTGTPDHRVMTDEGWTPLAEAACYGRRITRTGFGGVPIRFIGDSQSVYRRRVLEFACRASLRPLRKIAHGALSQFSEAIRNMRLPALQFEAACNRPKMALSALPAAAGSVHESEQRGVSPLRWAWDRISFFWCESCRDMDSRESRDKRSLEANRQDRQRRPLRAGKFAVGVPSFEREQFTQDRRDKSNEVYKFQGEEPGNKICGLNALQIYIEGDDGQGNYQEMAYPFCKTEGEVWDIINAGPLQRFTANGRLVHNCLFLDHSDTGLTLGLPDEIHYDQFMCVEADGERKAREKKEPLPKKCGKCGYLKPAKVHQCPCCGFMPEAQSHVTYGEGELAEIGRGGAKGKKATRDEKQTFWSELQWLASERGKTQSWCKANYRDKYGVWPTGLADKPAYPRQETFGWIKHKQIAWAKRKEKERATAPV